MIDYQSRIRELETAGPVIGRTKAEQGSPIGIDGGTLHWQFLGRLGDYFHGEKDDQAS